MIYQSANHMLESKAATPAQLTSVGFVCQNEEPIDQEIYNMIDEVIEQVLGEQGLSAIIKQGDKVVIKVNIISPSVGRRGEKGRGIITDPRIVRYVAEKVREIIGFSGSADLKVVDATFYSDSNPSLTSRKSSFHWARLERTGDNVVDDTDFCYDSNGNGFLDGSSFARLINLDSLTADQRQTVRLTVAGSEEITLCLPKFLRTRQEAGDSDEYCDVLIGLPVFKSHPFTGMTGAIKLHYGFRPNNTIEGDTGRWGHSGLFWDSNGVHNKKHLLNYLCAEHLVRTYDLVIMDCLTGNRRGPQNINPSLLLEDDEEPVDYILTNSLLASRDSVAIDTVETAFAGYEAASIELLKTARLNGIGTDEPKNILLLGLTRFCNYRQRIYNHYHPQDLYPFQKGWSDAHVIKSIRSPFTINISNPIFVEENLYSLTYCTQIPPGSVPDLVRAELWINGALAAYRTEGNLEQANFIFDITLYPECPYLLCSVVLWDRIFNCTLSPDIIFTPVP